MSERFHAHVEQTDRERAMALARAAGELGKFGVRAIANEGETFVTNKGRDAVVGEGKIAVELSGMGDQGPLAERANQIMQEQQIQQEQQPADSQSV